MTDTTINPPVEGNQPEARDPSGTLKDQGNTIPSSNPPQTNEPAGQTFLTQKPEPAKTEGEAPKEGDKPTPLEGAPEKYEDFKLPDGYKFDEATGKEVTALFKELNLPQEGAQKLVDFYTSKLRDAVEAPHRAWADLQKEWITDLQDRFGSKANTVRTDINSAITNALPPSLARAFRTALDVTGAGSNPDIFEALAILAKPHLEGKPVPAGKPNGAANEPVKPQTSLADAIYPHLAANRGS